MSFNTRYQDSLRFQFAIMAGFSSLAIIMLFYSLLFIYEKDLTKGQINTVHEVVSDLYRPIAAKSIHLNQPDFFATQTQSDSPDNFIAAIVIKDAFGSVFYQLGELDISDDAENVFMFNIGHTVNSQKDMELPSTENASATLGKVIIAYNTEYFEQRTNMNATVNLPLFGAAVLIVVGIGYLAVRRVKHRLRYAKSVLKKLEIGVPVKLEDKNDEITMLTNQFAQSRIEIGEIQSDLRQKIGLLQLRTNEVQDFHKRYVEATGFKNRFIKGFTQTVKHPSVHIDQLNNYISERLGDSLFSLLNFKKQLKKISSPDIQPLLPELDLIQMQLDTAINASDQTRTESSILNTRITEILVALDVVSEEIQLLPREHNICDILLPTIEEYNLKAKSKKLVFSVEICDDIKNCNIVIDATHYVYVIRALLSNAFKHTDVGSVKLEITSTRSSDNLTVLAKVSDTGDGISEKQQRLIFTAFRAPETDYSPATSGIGMTLATSRTIANRMRGSLSLLHSTQGVGASFGFKINTDVMTSDTSDKVELPMTIAGKTVLHVDDEKVLLDLIQYQLHNRDMIVRSVSNGKEGLEHYRQHYKEIDVIITDCYMPVMTGWDMMADIREFEKDNGIEPCVIIATSADDTPSNQIKCINLGANLFLKKHGEVHRLHEHILKELITHQKSLADKAKDNEG